MTSLLGLILVLIIVGIALAMLPIEATIKRVLVGIVIIVAVIWLFSAMGWVSAPAAFR